MSLIRQRIKGVMGTADAAKQMMVCAIAYDLVFGTANALESVRRAAIREIIFDEVYRVIYPPQYGPMVVKWMQQYPLSTFKDEETNNTILRVFKEHYERSEELTRKLIYNS
jgi:hypothetical protein